MFTRGMCTLSPLPAPKSRFLAECAFAALLLEIVSYTYSCTDRVVRAIVLFVYSHAMIMANSEYMGAKIV